MGNLVGKIRNYLYHPDVNKWDYYLYGFADTALLKVLEDTWNGEMLSWQNLGIVGTNAFIHVRNYQIGKYNKKRLEQKAELEQRLEGYREEQEMGGVKGSHGILEQ